MENIANITIIKHNATTDFTGLLLHGSAVKGSLSAVDRRYCVTRTSPTRIASNREERKRFFIYQFLFTSDGKFSEAWTAYVMPFAYSPNNANFRNVMIFDTVILLVIERTMANCELGSFRSLITPFYKNKFNTKLIATFPIVYLHQFIYRK